MCLLAAFLVGIAGIAAIRPEDTASDRVAIQKVLDEHGIAWTKGDPVAAAAV